jgi:hypothetical protein
MNKSYMPDKGLYCAFVLPKRQRFFSSLEKTEAFIAEQDEAGHTAFLAQGTYRARGNRLADNVMYVRSFWMDIDCGVEGNFPDQRAGLDALLAFCKTTKLPIPNIINSGYGLYARWILTEQVTRVDWQPVADMLKALTLAHSFKVDQSRTADAASVLRIAGTRNLKAKCTECGYKIKGAAGAPCERADCTGTAVVASPLVRHGKAEAPVTFKAFSALVVAAHRVAPITDAPAKAKPKKDDLNAEFIDFLDEGGEFPPSDANIIVRKCAQIRRMRDSKGDIPEPEWYHCIQVLRHTIQAPEIIHAWSKGDHGKYSESATNSKIKQLEAGNVGPACCSTLKELYPTGCAGCDFEGKVKSPIQLGVVIETVELEEGEVAPPAGYTRGKRGLYATYKEMPACFYPHDLCVESVAYDAHLQAEVINIKHTLPHEGTREFAMRTSALVSQKDALTVLADNHVTVPSRRKGWEKSTMVDYLESYAEMLKKNRKMDTLVTQMGWHEDDTQFVVGKQVIKPNHVVDEVSFSKNAPPYLRGFSTRGELQPWVDATEIFGAPGMEPLAFALLAGAFATPLVKWSGLSGAIVSLLGPSGAGKSMVGEFVMSAYGDPTLLLMNAGDTALSVISRLGGYNNLPVYMDEVTTLDPKAMTQFAYRVTQGRDRARLNQNAIEKAVLNRWQTLALVSSNSSIITKLGADRADPGAVINRVFEYPVPLSPSLTREASKQVYGTMYDNYGIAGSAYLKHLVDNTDELRDGLASAVALIDQRTGATPDERFWSMVAGAAIYGGMMARKLGLIKFELGPVLHWVTDIIPTMRDNKEAQGYDPINLLGQYLDYNAGNTVIVHHGNNMGWWLREKAGAEYNQLKKDLHDLGVLEKFGFPKRIGAVGLTGAPQRCWQVNLAHPAVQGTVTSIVKKVASPPTDINEYKKGLT